GGAGGGVVLRRAATVRERLGVVLARAGRRVGADDSMVTAGSEVCACASEVAAAMSPSRKAAPINHRALKALLRVCVKPSKCLFVTVPATSSIALRRWRCISETCRTEYGTELNSSNCLLSRHDAGWAGAACQSFAQQALLQS